MRRVFSTVGARVCCAASPSPILTMTRTCAARAPPSPPSRASARVSPLDVADGFTAQVEATPGYSAEDAFGQHDPLSAVEHTLKSDPAPPAEPAVTDLASEMDTVVNSRNRRRNRRKRTADAILGDVLHDALLLRDMGEKPTTDFVYKRTQERMYEEEYGRKPPTAKENAAKYIPFPPDFHLHRLLPLYGEHDSAEAVSQAPSSAEAGTGAEDAAQRPAAAAPVYTKNAMHTYALVAPDPWPERAVTPANPVWTRRDVETDKEKTGGAGFREWEARMYGPRPGYDLSGELVDAMDELGHWEVQLLQFLRDAPLSQRRSLPFLHEWYRLLVHRVIRAERRYIRIRDALVADAKVSSALYKRTEQPVDAIRSYYAEAHRSLSSPNYDPQRMKKSALAPLMRMTAAEFDEWRAVQRQRRNALAAELA